MFTKLQWHLQRQEWHNSKIITRIHLCVDISSVTLTALKCKMLCTEQLTAKLCPVFYSVRLAHKTNTCFPFFPADYENFRHVLSMKNDDLPLSNMANTETNVCYKILRAGYCLLVVTQENVFSRCTMTKEYFSISHLPNFFLTVQNECILLCLNGMSKAAMSREVIRCTFSVHQCTKVHFFGALVHQSALLLVFQCTSAPNTKQQVHQCTETVHFGSPFRTTHFRFVYQKYVNRRTSRRTSGEWQDKIIEKKIYKSKNLKLYKET